MRTVFLVPRRTDGGHRDTLWEYAKARWQTYFPDWAIVEGHHDDGPFNRSAAVNRASDAAGEWDLAIVIDSDVLLSVSQVQAAVERAAETGRVTWAHRRWRGIREDMAKRIVADAQDLGPELSRDELDLMVERTNPISWSCCMVVPRKVWDDTGGMDERFVGWGYEDMAWQSLIAGLYGYERIEGDVIHLWHPRSEERITKGETASTATADYNRNARWGRRYMVAARRDHGIHDRTAPSDAAEMARDIENLLRDDAKVALRQSPEERRQFDGWWPTLEELRDGAKAIRGMGTGVTLVLRTGGESETWPERASYLRRSLASLDAHVSGPIIQKVIYSDWAPDHRVELQAIAAEHGFYVVGPAGHVGYPDARRMLWSYLEKRARGDYIFSVEDDFLYDRDVDLAPMIQTLRDNPNLRQLALLRAPAFPREFEAGGVIESLKTPVTLQNHREFPFMEHRDHWTDNPALYRKSMVKTPWPNGTNTERRFGDAVLRDPKATFAYWGSGETWITHIGEVRAASVY